MFTGASAQSLARCSVSATMCRPGGWSVPCENGRTYMGPHAKGTRQRGGSMEMGTCVRHGLPDGVGHGQRRFDSWCAAHTAKEAAQAGQYRMTV